MRKVASSAAACSGVGRSLTCTTSFTTPKLSFGPCHRDRNPTCAGAGAEPLSARCAYSVFTPGYRCGVFTGAPPRRCEEIMIEVCGLLSSTASTTMSACSSAARPRVVLAALVDSLKGVSARLLRKEYPAVRRYLRGGRLRSPSYVAASRGGALLRLVKKYIENQERPDQRPDVHNPRTGKRFLPGVNARGSSLDNAEAR
ncbi:transposase [Streptosporangium amethystogenes subsp. fukuiense]|uniref:Transposase n=1 Tax=Streptosporangium amethystogenes subsp. fukuiense TaxID=698418 RepID=A0ABW2SUL9_9ACTN